MIVFENVFPEEYVPVLEVLFPYAVVGPKLKPTIVVLNNPSESRVPLSVAESAVIWLGDRVLVVGVDLNGLEHDTVGKAGTDAVCSLMLSTLPLDIPFDVAVGDRLIVPPL